jgi:hypothetical protein
MSDRTEKLLQRAAELDHEGGVVRRREELLRRATEAGYEVAYADQLYDVAVEEHVDPAAALELVICGVGVREFDQPPTDEWEETQVEAPPAWLEGLPPAEEAARERQLRASFRRLRSKLENTTSVREAVSQLVSEPDVGDVDY